MLSKNSPIYQCIKSLILIALLAGCDMPEKPAGADMEGMNNIAGQLRSRGDDAGAIEFYQRGLQRNPTDTKSRIAMAQILEAHGNNQEAALQYTEALHINPDNGEWHRDLGRVLIKSGRAAEAKDEYEKALTIDSDDTKAMNGLGIALDYLGNHDAAQKVYKNALEEKSDNLNTLNNLAHSYVLVGSYGEAIKLLESHIKDKGATPALRQNLAEAYGMAGMEADAERVGRMDLTPDQVKHNLEFYRARRGQLSLMPKFYAELGNFPTEAMAEGRMDQIKANFPKETAGLVIEIKSEVRSIGGTPSFALTATGFARPEKLRNFCDKLKKGDIACKAHGV